MAKKKRRLESGSERTARGSRNKKNTQQGRKAAGRTGRQNMKSSRRRKKGSLTTGKKVLVGFCVLLLIFVLAAIVGVAYIGNKMGKLNTGTLDLDKLSISDELEYDETGYLNVALFGLDSRATDESMGSRSDTIIIGSLNRKTKEVKMTSVYRDTLMKLDDGEYYKANAAYAYGEEEEAVAMLNRNLDMSITHYVTVDFSALVDVIDAVGGIDIDVTQEEIDGVNGYSINGYIMEVMENTGKESPGVTEPGLQTLNGVQATAYARIRFTDGSDYKRTERQRLVLEKIAQKLQKSNLATLDKIIDKVFSKVKTNFTLTEILAYAKDVSKYKIGESKGFPFNVDSLDYKDQGSVVISTSALSDVQELHKFFFGEDGYTPTSTLTSICNELSSIYNAGGTDYSNSGTYDDSGTDYSGTDYSDTGESYGSDYNYDNSGFDYGNGDGAYGDTGDTAADTGDDTQESGGNDDYGAEY